MNSVKEIENQLEAERKHLVDLYEQVKASEERIAHLAEEHKAVEEEGLQAYVDHWLQKKFGIQNQTEARMKTIFLVFDKEANFVQTVTCGLGEDFHYVSPAEEEDTMEHWLKEKGLYAHRASSFCGRNGTWYQKSFREQLENLGWEFDAAGKLANTQW